MRQSRSRRKRSALLDFFGSGRLFTVAVVDARGRVRCHEHSRSHGNCISRQRRRSETEDDAKKEEKAEEQAAATKTRAIKDTAEEKLYGGQGFDGAGGLTRLLKGLNHIDGKGVRESEMFSGAQTNTYALAQATKLESYGVGVDREAIIAGGETAQSAIADITRQLGTMIDAYKMQERTGVVADNVPTTAQPLAEVTEATKPQNTTTPPVVEKDAMSGDIGAGMSQEELLAELVRLTQINTNLLKKGNRITEAIEV